MKNTVLIHRLGFRKYRNNIIHTAFVTMWTGWEFRRDGFSSHNSRELSTDREKTVETVNGSRQLFGDREMLSRDVDSSPRSTWVENVSGPRCRRSVQNRSPYNNQMNKQNEIKAAIHRVVLLEEQCTMLNETVYSRERTPFYIRSSLKIEQNFFFFYPKHR